MRKLMLLSTLTGATFLPCHANVDVPATLTLNPKQCVALHQGEHCYSELTIHWQASTQGHYCLTQSDRKKPLKCWEKSLSGTLTLELQFNQNVVFALQDIQQHTLASAQLTYAWVYNKSKNTRVKWRMF
ncbi:hypothetical protein CWB99_09475 [Pseudoalteromonas rubra]|uniref:DUF3019 domain-containing protein n=1 Tax=Pseudoalteromonas rubra TaxID=43658 RepID=A0A5S3WQ14_9GAMM|nr:DUF3019 domain-containing protein [Pseudoalteromonas rubra]TMP29414.1 hypothetical protein CWB99_09475 [Pseudoalteromonas rubra]TMP33984.1 hypothetical protein CWC00_08770 [Pseudoalteromonas rubra]